MEATYKSRELEGLVDLLFYRRIGFRIAQICAGLHIRPNGVTLIGGLIGVLAGHLYFYRDLALNLIGLLLQVVANIFDNADGQLARLTNHHTRAGRILDPVVDHVIWVSIYVHLALRLRIQGFPETIWLLAIAAGISHGAQAAAADYCRNAYLHFARGGNGFDSVSKLTLEYCSLAWSKSAWPKILLWLYLNIMREQEFLFPGLRKLYEKTQTHRVSDELTSSYVALARPTFKWWGLLMTNVRIFVLFLVFLAHQPVWYFWLELTLGNILLLYLVLRQERISEFLIRLATRQQDP
jgi:phosphatidylserine synthase